MKKSQSSSAPEIDWTIDEIPGPRQPEPPEDDRMGRAPRGWRPGRGTWLLLGLVATVALAGWLVVRRGWNELRAQVAREVAYEDERSLAADVPAVTAVQADGYRLWADLRAAQAAAALPAPLPASGLLPSGQPPEVVALEPAGLNLFDATVRRTFVDPAGQAHAFDLVQRYANPQPGLWERLPPDTARLITNDIWAGERLVASVPSADAGRLAPVLAQVDAALARACRPSAWDCPEPLLLEVIFAGSLDGQAQVALGRTARPPNTGNYPFSFDLPFERLEAGTVWLAAPSLAGWPASGEAEALRAYTRATSVRLLGALAARLVEQPAYRRDEFFTALVARAELSLDLAPRGAAPVSASLRRPGPADYLPTFVLWNLDARREAVGLRPDLSFRRLAYDLLDTALATEPVARRPAIEAALLRALGRPQTLSDWLVAGLGQAGWRIETNWRRDLVTRLAAEAKAGLARLDGLALACTNSPLQVVAQGALRDLALHVDMIAPLWFADLLPSPAGRYLATLNLSVDARSQVVVLDLATGQHTPVTTPAGTNRMLGWSAGGYLYYLDTGPRLGDSRSYEYLHRFDPATGRAEQVWSDPVLPPMAGRLSIWSADHTRLAIAGISSPGTPAAMSYPAVLAADAPLDAPFEERATVYRGVGVEPALSPDGTRLAVFTTSHAEAAGALAALPGIRDQVELIDVATGERERFLTVDDLPTGRDSHYFALGSLAWSPDGRWLTLTAFREGAGPHLYLLPASVVPGTRPAPQRLHTGQTDVLALVGFSADARYLAVMDWAAFGDLNQVVVFDLTVASAAAVPAAFTAYSAAWSPAGHTLAIAGPLGVFALEPFASPYQWLASSPFNNWQCELGWGE